MTRIFFLFATIGLLSLSSCGSDGALIDMSYAETQCADAWGTFGGSTESEVQVALESYFDDLNIAVSEITVVDHGDIITCQACDCSSNRTISLKVSEDHQTKMEAEGFVIK